MKWIENNIFPLLPAFVFVILATANLKIDLSFKVDTILIIIGNFAVALFEYSEVADGHRRLWKDTASTSFGPRGTRG